MRWTPLILALVLVACDSGGMEEVMEAGPGVDDFLGTWQVSELTRLTESGVEDLTLGDPYRMEVTQPTATLVTFELVRVAETGVEPAIDVMVGFTCATIDFSEDGTPEVNCERFRVGRRETLQLAVRGGTMSGSVTRWTGSELAEWSLTMSARQ